MRNGGKAPGFHNFGTRCRWQPYFATNLPIVHFKSGWMLPTADLNAMKKSLQGSETRSSTPQLITSLSYICCTLINRTEKDVAHKVLSNWKYSLALYVHNTLMSKTELLTSGSPPTRAMLQILKVCGLEQLIIFTVHISIHNYLKCHYLHYYVWSRDIRKWWQFTRTSFFRRTCKILLFFRVGLLVV
jgi:hypothetical protein